MKKNLSILLAIVFLFTTAFGGFAGVAHAETNEVTNRISGADRYETAHKIALVNGDKADTVIIVRGDGDAKSPNVVDGLTASVLAGKLEAPILLTSSETLPAKTKAAITGLGAKKAYIIGGVNAITPAVVAELEALNVEVTRVSGEGRVETAVEVAKEAATDSKTAIIVQSHAEVDSLVAGPLAYTNKYPILLVSKDSVPEATKDAIKDLGIENLIIVGGTGVVSAEVQTELKTLATVERLAGEGRELTSIAVAKELDATEVLLVNGRGYVDAVAASTLGLPIVYVSQDTMLEEVETFLGTKVSFKVIGGVSTISEKVVTKAAEAVIAELQVVSVSAIGASKLEVAFNKAIDAATATVKRGAITTNVKEVTLAEDGESLVVELVTKLSKGDYTVTVTVGEDVFVETVAVENEKVADIQFLSNNAVLAREDASNKTVNNSIRVFNQYGENITATTTDLTFSVSKGYVTDMTNTGVITINNDGSANGRTNAPYTIDEKVVISVIHAGSQTFASNTLTVTNKANVGKVEITQLHHANDLTPVAGGTNASSFNLILEAKDQYGNAWGTGTQARLDLASDVIITASNPSVANVSTSVSNVTVGTATKNALQLTSIGVAGTSTVTIMSKTTGDIIRFDIVVKEAKKIDQLSVSAPTLAVAGEKVELDFAAIDQFGNDITRASELNASGAMLSTLTTSAGTISFVQDHVKGTAKLVLDLEAVEARTTAFITGITGTGKVVQLQVAVVDTAIPTVIAGVKDVVRNYTNNGNFVLGFENVIVLDQYGREMDTLDLGVNKDQYQITVSTSSAARVAVSGAITDADDVVNLTGGATTGAATITVRLVTVEDEAVEADPEADPAVEAEPAVLATVTNSAFAFAVNNVAKSSITSFVVEDVDTLYSEKRMTTDATPVAIATPENYARPLTVYGVLANGQQVAIDSAFYNVHVVTAGVEYNNGMLLATNGVAFGANTNTATATVIVTFDNATSDVITKSLTISKAVPVITTLELRTGEIGAVESNGLVSVALDAGNTQEKLETLVGDVVKVVDQYGEEIEATFTVIPTNFPAGRSFTSETALVAGQSYNVTAITGNGIIITFKVILT